MVLQLEEPLRGERIFRRVAARASLNIGSTACRPWLGSYAAPAAKAGSHHNKKPAGAIRTSRRNVILGHRRWVDLPYNRRAAWLNGHEKVMKSLQTKSQSDTVPA